MTLMYSRFFTTDFTQGGKLSHLFLMFQTSYERNSSGYLTFSGERNTKVLLRILPRVTGSRKSKLAAVKPTMFIYPLPDKIVKKFRRLPQVFAVQEHNDTNANTDRCMQATQIQHGGRKTGSIYYQFINLYAYLHFKTRQPRNSNGYPPCVRGPGT